MGFWESVKTCVSKYAIFGGRAARSEYWWFQLFYFITLVGAAVLDELLNTPHTPNNTGMLTVLVYLGLFLPLLSANVRRLHDVNRSGSWIWISLTIIGLIPLLVWMCTKGTPGDNRFGVDPLPMLDQHRPEQSQASTPLPDKVEQLTKLQKLLENGAINQQEFEKLKAELLK